MAHQARHSVTARETSPDAAVYFEDVARAFDRAAARGGSNRRTLAIGGHEIELRFAGGPLLAHLEPALDHLFLGSPSDRPASLRIDVFESDDSGEPLPPPPWDRSTVPERGEVRLNEGDRWRLVYRPWVPLLQMADLERGRAILWTHARHSLMNLERGVVLRNIFNWWTAGRPLQLIHAAAVGTDDGGVLLTGRGGSGKSTSALACLGSPLRIAGDDFVLLEQGAPSRVHSIDGAVKVERKTPLRVSGLDEPALPEDKHLLLLGRSHPGSLIRSFPLRAILLPRVTGRALTRIVPVGAGEALRAMAPSTLLELAGAYTADFRRLSGIARSVPCFTLEAGTDLTQIPVEIGRLLDRLRA